MYRDEDWQDNDGALNTISMTHPRFPIEHPSRFVEKDSDCQPLEPGIWLVMLLSYISFTSLTELRRTQLCGKILILFGIVILLIVSLQPTFFSISKVS